MDRAALAKPGSTIWRDASLSAIVAGFVAVLVGYTSSAAIVFEAARALGADDRGIASWMGALGLGMLAAGVREERDREAAVVTFLVTASGVALAGIGSAFWGLAAGLAVRAILKPTR